jgi:uncharacterized membrane protein YfcA
MTPMVFLGLMLSAMIGLSLGLIGGGGPILTVPILVYFLDVGPHEAVAMSLAVVGVTSLFGSFLHYRNDNVDLRAAFSFGLAGMAGAYAGSPLTKLVSPSTLMMIFGALMLTVAASMILRKKVADPEARHRPHQAKGVFAGFAVGVLTGFLGVGGGFLIVPALVLFGGHGMKKAVGTWLVVIFLNCAAGLAGHLSQTRLDVALTTVVAILAVGGAIAGTVVSRRLAAHHLQKAVAAMVLFIGAFLVVQNYAAAH